MTYGHIAATHNKDFFQAIYHYVYHHWTRFRPLGLRARMTRLHFFHIYTMEITDKTGTIVNNTQSLTC